MDLRIRSVAHLFQISLLNFQLAGIFQSCHFTLRANEAVAFCLSSIHLTLCSLK